MRREVKLKTGKSTSLLVPRQIRDVITQDDVAVMFSFLETRFFLSSSWRERFLKEHASTQPEFFFYFAKTNLDDHLRVIRNRQSMDSVIDDIAIYLLRHKLADRIKTDKSLQDFFESFKWNK